MSGCSFPMPGSRTHSRPGASPLITRALRAPGTGKMSLKNSKKVSLDNCTYNKLMAWWQAAIATKDPDRQQLLDLHRALCLDELMMFQQEPQLCFKNLHERLEGARSLELDLPLPVWAGLDMAELITAVEATAGGEKVMAGRCAIYARVSTVEQHPETQLHDLQKLAEQRGLEVVSVYTDRVSGAKSKRPALDQLLADAHRGKFGVVLVWAFDRLARSVKHFLEVLDELNHLNIEFISFRENIDTGGPLGRAVVVIVSAVAELERNLIIERVRAGLRRARLEGRRLGRAPLDIDRAVIRRDRERGLSLAQLARLHCISRSSVARVLKQEGVPPRV